MWRCLNFRSVYAYISSKQVVAKSERYQQLGQREPNQPWNWGADMGFQPGATTVKKCLYWSHFVVSLELSIFTLLCYRYISYLFLCSNPWICQENVAFLDDALTPKALQVLTDHFLEALAHRDFLQVKFMSIQPRITHAHLKSLKSHRNPKGTSSPNHQPPFFQGLC